ncbi:AAA family ATPase [bacterium]|nr:AAA family ATPase [bacterium]
MREDDTYYVDKTGFALDMVERGSHYFLSRPRRFGKSLLIDTFKELFEGNQALFTGLIAEPRSMPLRQHCQRLVPQKRTGRL